MTPRTLLLAFALVIAACSSGDDAATSTPAPDPTTTETAEPATSAAAATTEPDDTVPDDVASTTSQPVNGEASTTTQPSGGSATSRPSAPPTTRPELTAEEIADQALARTALITIADFPDDWVETPADDDDDDPVTEAFEDDFDACLGRDASDQIGDLLERIEANTGDFHPAENDSTQVSHEVTLAPDEPTAIDRMAETDVSGAEDCIAGVIGDFYRAAAANDPELGGIEIGDVVVTRTETEREADLTNAALIEVDLLADGQTVPLYLEFLFQRQGRALSQLSFQSFGEPFSRDGYEVLSDQAVVRLATIG